MHTIEFQHVTSPKTTDDLFYNSVCVWMKKIGNSILTVSSVWMVELIASLGEY